MNNRSISPPPLAVGAPPLSNARLATILFISTELMLFVGFIAGYVVLRYGSNNFDGMVAPTMGLTAISTPVLLLSSVALIIAQRAYRRGSPTSFQGGTVITLLLGLVFLALQYAEWNHLISSGIIPAGNVNSGMFYLLSGVHGVHVCGGIVLLTLLTFRAFRSPNPAKSSGMLGVASIYWHFVTLLWLTLFILLFML